MNSHEDRATGTAWEGPGDRARQFIREYRDLLQGYAAVPDIGEPLTAGHPAMGYEADSTGAAAGEGTTVAARAPLKVVTASDLPIDMRELLERYEREHPGIDVRPVAYLTVGGHDASRNAFGFADLPPEEDLVVLALTETVASIGGVEARSRVLLLRRGENR